MMTKEATGWIIVGVYSAVGAAFGFMAGRLAPRKWKKSDYSGAYWQGYSDGLQKIQRHEYRMKDLETRPDVVEKVVKVPVPEPVTPLVAVAKAIDACTSLADNNSTDKKEE